MPQVSVNPYRFDQDDQEHCAICRASLTPPRRGPTPIYCTKSECRRTGAMNNKLAEAWQAGYEAGRGGKPVVSVAPVKRSRWEAAYAMGAKEVAEAVASSLQTLGVEIDMYSRNRSPERLKSLKRALAQTRAAARMRKPAAKERA